MNPAAAAASVAATEMIRTRAPDERRARACAKESTGVGAATSGVSPAPGAP